MSGAHVLTEAHPLARPYLAGDERCPILSPSGQALVGVGGRFAPGAERFFVHERPLYRASGVGEHCLAHILKQGRSTDEALEAIAQASGLALSDLGYAGRKDRDALTTQWISAPCAPERLRSEDPDVLILSALRHEQKLKPGHLAGNLFSLYIDELEAPDRLERCVEQLALGLPNYFGPQRFGKPWYATPIAEDESHPVDEQGRFIQDPLNPATDNVDRALSALSNVNERGKRRPNKRLHKLTLSALQSALFNLWLGERLRDGLSQRVLEGDVCRKVGGGTFNSSDPEEDTERLLRGDIDVLGPLIGPKLFPARAEARTREELLYQRWGLTEELRAQMGRAWRGDRRAMTLKPLGLSARREGHGAWLSFALPSGAFATTVVGALIDPDAAFRRSEEARSL